MECVLNKNSSDGVEMIKVLFLIPNLGHGGAEKVLVNLLNHMDSSKFNITVMTLYDEGVNRQFLNAGITYKTCFKRSFHGVSHLLKVFSPRFLYRRLIKDKYQIVISYLEGQTARIVSGCPYSDSKLVSWIHVEQHTAKNAARTFRSVKEMQISYNRFDEIVAVSEYVKQDFEKITHLKNRVKILYNTVESDKIRKLADEEAADIKKSGSIKLCGVGTLKKSKGFDRLLRTHSRLVKDGYMIETYILGEGAELENLQKLARDLGIENDVHFLGYQTNPYKYLSKCDIFVCTSFAEGFSTAATEALIVGTSVCTVEVSGMKEMLGENDEYGIVTENNEEAFYLGLKKLIESPETLKRYKILAKQRGKDFDTKSTVQAVENFLTNLIGE